MPVIFIDGPAGLPLTKRRTLTKKIHDALVDAYAIEETTIFLREHAGDCVAIDGELRASGGRPALATEPSSGGGR